MQRSASFRLDTAHESVVTATVSVLRHAEGVRSVFCGCSPYILDMEMSRLVVPITSKDTLVASGVQVGRTL